METVEGGIQDVIYLSVATCAKIGHFLLLMKVERQLSPMKYHPVKKMSERMHNKETQP